MCTSLLYIHNINYSKDSQKKMTEFLNWFAQERIPQTLVTYAQSLKPYFVEYNPHCFLQTLKAATRYDIFLLKGPAIQNLIKQVFDVSSLLNQNA